MDTSSSNWKGIIIVTQDRERERTVKGGRTKMRLTFQPWTVCDCVFIKLNASSWSMDSFNLACSNATPRSCRCPLYLSSFVNIACEYTPNPGQARNVRNKEVIYNNIFLICYLYAILYNISYIVTYSIFIL